MILDIFPFTEVIQSNLDDKVIWDIITKIYNQPMEGVNANRVMATFPKIFTSKQRVHGAFVEEVRNDPECENGIFVVLERAPVENDFPYDIEHEMERVYIPAMLYVLKYYWDISVELVESCDFLTNSRKYDRFVLENINLKYDTEKKFDDIRLWLSMQ